MGVVPPHTISETLFSAETLQQRVCELGAQITADYPDASEPLLLVGVLKGAALFLADLARSIGRPLEFDFVALSSRGSVVDHCHRVMIEGDDGAVTLC